MKRIILSALVALTAFGGVASADRGRGVRHSQGGVSVTHSRGRYVQPRGHVTYNRGYVARPSYRYVRRPIYVQRPRIAYHYYNYYQRPALLVENYAAVPGYYWVAGQWNWDGYEWIWTPGHYEPDPNAAGYYSNTYSSGYYANPYYDSGY
ncbi:MAG TPA: hypothetical protein VFV99_15420 [Kofleriaceae bacterium]|nr:hypothetical protein [Kofleriaceae bacterium]